VVPSTVSIVGLGNMGSAMAQALLRAGVHVVVYNRTPSRSEPLREAGATVAGSLAEAIAATSASIVSVAGYDAARKLFFGSDQPDIRGKTIIQLSSGTPTEARDWSRMCTESGADTLTGAVLALPMHIGTPRAHALLSGPERLYVEYKPLLDMLATTKYVSESPGGASAFDCAVLTNTFLSVIGWMQGIEMCRAEGIDTEIFVAFLNERVAFRAEVNQMIHKTIAENNYTNPQASVDVCGAVTHHIAEIIEQNHMSPIVSNMLVQLFTEAHERGLGDLDIAALALLLRNK
jgi:3-hydroxyisobutyrate dehydrogenase-like beta-hydroxyacid dehydrogenase